MTRVAIVYLHLVRGWYRTFGAALKINPRLAGSGASVLGVMARGGHTFYGSQLPSARTKQSRLVVQSSAGRGRRPGAYRKLCPSPRPKFGADPQF